MCLCHRVVLYMSMLSGGKYSCLSSLFQTYNCVVTYGFVLIGTLIDKRFYTGKISASKLFHVSFLAIVIHNFGLTSLLTLIIYQYGNVFMS